MKPKGILCWIFLTSAVVLTIWGLSYCLCLSYQNDSLSGPWQGSRVIEVGHGRAVYGYSRDTSMGSYLDMLIVPKEEWSLGAFGYFTSMPYIQEHWHFGVLCYREPWDGSLLIGMSLLYSVFSSLLLAWLFGYLAHHRAKRPTQAFPIEPST